MSRSPSRQRRGVQSGGGRAGPAPGGPGGRGRAILVGILAAGFLVILGAAAGTTYAIQQENHDDFCASCHTQPEAQYYQQTLDKNLTSLAAFHSQKSVRCIDCHSGAGPLGRAQGLSQGAKDAIAYYSGHYHAPAIVTNRMMDDSCTKCHGDISTTGDFNNHFHRFLPQWQAVDKNAAHCVDCHTTHTTGDPNQGYLVQAGVVAVCQACHAAAGEGGEGGEGNRRGG